MLQNGERAQRKPRAEPESGPESEPKAEGEPKVEGEPEVEGEPKVEGESKAEGEPKVEGEPESENHPYTKPTSEYPQGETEPSATPENWPEPGPRWEQAYETWRWAWELHVYLYATIFLLIGLYAGYYVIANVYDGLQGKYLSVSLNIMVSVFGFTRAFVMFLDPYHQGGMIHNTAVMRVIWSLGGPCLTASDSLMILSLIETAKISVAPPKLQKANINIIIISFHFALVITTDCVVSDYVEAKAMLLFCQLFFVTWGSVLGTINFVLGYKLDQQLFSHKNPKETADKIYIFLIYASGLANYFLCAIIVYSAFGVFGVYSDIQFVDAWPWWALQTMSRFSEILACVLIFTVSAKRTRVKRAVSQLTDEKSLDTIIPEEISSTQSFSWTSRFRNCFKRKKVAADRNNGSVISLFTALREMALAATGENWYGTKPGHRIKGSGECWVEKKTTSSIIHLPGKTKMYPHGNTFDDLGSDDEEVEKEYLQLEFRSIQERRSSMFTALHDAKKKRKTAFSPGKTTRLKPLFQTDNVGEAMIKKIDSNKQNSDETWDTLSEIKLPNMADMADMAENC
ncbi:hypothetical protein AWC38_SpisGene10063 [Stylophora pistillata]|uniref:Proline-rich transmembrane protein 3/4 domain-containing protein n=2 Tax=Stylophora pistillata TaxID=50429 RepID=A0A2B4S7D1_STYPI|nr:hypothetical protein AWC38_SpisGene10063 [Stylophora pistillata]